MQHPLDETFNMKPDENITEILGVDIKIPKDPNLRTIVEFSLNQYKSLIEESMLLEPDQRLRHVEIAREYLRMAKDAMRDESDLEIKYMRAANGKMLEKKDQPKLAGTMDDLYKQIEDKKKEK